jgi:S-DNA-T family DNA segregation ATPase FtsK/SpoIIIE
MATRAATTGRDTRIVPASTGAAFRRGVAIVGGVALLLLAVALVTALVSYGPRDPSFDTVTGRVPQNLLGISGAWLADALLFATGYAAIALVPVLAIGGVRLLRRKGLAKGRRYALATLAGTLLLAGAIGALWPDPDAALPAGSGGLTGLFTANAGDALAAIPALAAFPMASLLALVFGMIALPLLIWGSGIDRGDVATVAALLRHRDDTDADADAPPVERRRRPAPDAAAAIEQAAAPRATIVTPAAPAPVSAKRGRRDRQPTLGLGDIYELPPLDLLKPVPKGPVVKIDRASLEQNARLLESVLDDFGVKGRIGDVRPGPVVTMYELEPAPGLKASRVIGLSDDIARSMSAVSARVAVVPGRNVIGIELPNPNRQMVTLSELLASAAFEDQSAALPLVLGKNIAGDPVIADLSPMPHLLIAGTTGSGKSVGLNCMILSLLYRLTPDQCRMIMIDPKMLELSVYDRIPHLLSPVVTEPAKAIRALKWAVEQMEDRYRMMSTINVRSLSGFNQRVREAKASGKPFIRKVHTGYNDDGHAIYEEETLDFEPLPLIVVVVDELADLMMTAGKEVEFLIQRLAQKARAAGIHLIMATQRPSVDVITGVIKANLPTRISFSVTSKIDSRTILGEQGAEQLLGKGDMLYMPGGKQVVRVHGPFVSDEEVEAVADYCRTQGRPDYVDAVTAEPDEGDGVFGLDMGEGGGEEAETYRKAIMIVAESRKASTSYLQRQLRVGYNNAARLIERMEKDGFVGVADHVGRREVLIEPDGTRQ